MPATISSRIGLGFLLMTSACIPSALDGWDSALSISENEPGNVLANSMYITSGADSLVAFADAWQSCSYKVAVHDAAAWH